MEDWNVDAPSYDFTKLDPDNEEDRKTFNKYLIMKDLGQELADGKIYK